MCLDCAGAGFTDSGARLVLSAGDGRIIEVDLKSGRITDGSKMPPGIAFAVADVPGQGLALNMADGETMWFENGARAAVSLGIHADAVSAAVKLPDGRVALGFLDGAIEIVNPDMHSMIATVDLWPETHALFLSAIRSMRGLWQTWLAGGGTQAKAD